MKEVLHAVQHDRLLRAVGDRDDRLHAQQIVAAHRRQRVEPARQRGPRDRLVADDAEGADAFVVAVDVVAVACRDDDRHRAVAMLRRDRLVLQPALHLDALLLRVEQAEIEQERRVDRAVGHAAAARRG